MSVLYSFLLVFSCTPSNGLAYVNLLLSGKWT